MIVIENKSVLVILVTLTADSSISRAEVTVGQVIRLVRGFARNGFTDPRTILSMGGDDNPLFAQRVPSLFPSHKSLSIFANPTNADRGLALRQEGLFLDSGSGEIARRQEGHVYIKHL